MIRNGLNWLLKGPTNNRCSLTHSCKMAVLYLKITEITTCNMWWWWGMFQSQSINPYENIHTSDSITTTLSPKGLVFEEVLPTGSMAKFISTKAKHQQQKQKHPWIFDECSAKDSDLFVASWNCLQMDCYYEEQVLHYIYHNKKWFSLMNYSLCGYDWHTWCWLECMVIQCCRRWFIWYLFVYL